MPLAETQILQSLIASLKPDLALCGYVMRPKQPHLSLRIDEQSWDCEKAS